MGGFAKIPAGLAALAVLTASPAFASGSEKAPIESTKLEPETAAAFSKQVERELAAKGARVALVFRAGQPREQLPEDIDYTHGAFWVYQEIERADGTRMRGYAVYNLYHGDGDKLPRSQSYLEQDFPYDFMSGSTADDVAVIIPDPELQRRLMKVIASPTYEALHVKDYSLISNVADPKYQNCNEFMLDVIAAAAWETSDYAQIKANLAKYFEPTEIEVGLFKRIFAPVFDDRVKADDHDGKIMTASYDSLVGFLAKYELLQETFVIYRDGDELTF